MCIAPVEVIRIDSNSNANSHFLKKVCFSCLELTPTSSQKSWKRPASASETERRLAESRRTLTHTLPGSDGEKDRR